METGIIVKWVKNEGDRVKSGDVLAEVQTDKSTLSWEASIDGYLAKILAPAGSETPVGATAAILVENKDNVKDFKDYVEKGSAPKAAPKQESPPPPAKESPKKAPAGPAPRTVDMPAMSPTMEEGKILRWLKKEGDKVKVGEDIAEIETDKAAVSVTLPEDDGIIAKLLAQPNVPVKIGAPIAIIVKDASEVAKFKDYTAADLGGAADQAPAPQKEQAKEVSSQKQEQAPVQRREGERIIASPLARANASKKGVELASLRGTGPNGRIIAADVAEYEAPKARAQPTPSAAQVYADYEDIQNSNIRQITADRLTASKQNIPHYYLNVDINVDNLLELRNTLNNYGKSKSKDRPDEFKLSVNDFVVKAAALAMHSVPQVNSEWRGTSIRRYKSVHINVAVNTERGLLTPVLKDADKLGLKTINVSIKELAQRAQQGKSTPADLQPGTFTISNLGMFGISNFAAVINPPQAAILAVGGARKMAVLDESANSGDLDKEPTFKVANVMTVTLSCDHRVVDGAVGAQWLQAFKDLLENPFKLLL